MFLINSAFVGKIILYLSKCAVKQQLKSIEHLRLIFLGPQCGCRFYKSSWRLAARFTENFLSSGVKCSWITVLIDTVLMTSAAETLFTSRFSFLPFRLVLYLFRFFSSLPHSGRLCTSPSLLTKHHSSRHESNNLGVDEAAEQVAACYRVARCTALSTHNTAWNTCCHNTAALIAMYFYWLTVQKCNFSKAQRKLLEMVRTGRNM
jgi:hypothetical protein